MGELFIWGKKQAGKAGNYGGKKEDPETKISH